jgi:autotransporter-associated beta strand protein
MKHRLRRSARCLALLSPLAVMVALWHSSSSRETSHGNVRNEAAKSSGRHAVPAPAQVDEETRKLVARQVAGDVRAQAEAGEPLPQDFLDRIVTGKSFSFALPDGTHAEGTVETSDRDAQGLLRIHGRITTPAPGTCFLQRQTVEGVAGPFVGQILFDGQSQGWKIEPTADHRFARFVQRDQNQILCVNYGRTTTADKMAYVGPPSHPTDQPLPGHQDVIPLQSLPGATGVIYLDFDGEKGHHQGWGTFDAAPAGRTNAEIFDIWKIVSEDFLPFNLNVTTDRMVFDNAPQGRRQKVIITPTTSATPSGAAGVAFMGSFNWGGDTPCWAHYTLGVYAAHVISHEVGHTLGLGHDGIPEYGYYSGHGGTGPTSWGPIMGDGVQRNLDTWSKGEYAGANNHEDDLSIIANNNNNVGYRTDDTGDTLATANYLEIFPGNTVASQGFIGSSSDIDGFRFVTSGGQATLNVNTVAVGPDLDILAQIVNAASGSVIVADNPDGGINATLSANLPAGEYLLRVRGTGRGDPLGDGYTNYASLGSYTISGSISGGVAADRFELAENSANGSAVGTVAARSNHGANLLTWAIASGNTNSAFTINPANGNITVANSAALNFEALSLHWDDPATFEMFVTITDSANPALNETIRVVVTVTDLNEALTMSGASIKILEGLPVGTRVATASVSDPDHFDVASYEITDGDPNGDFEIDSRTGEIRVAYQVSLTANTTYNLTVTATDSGSPAFSTSATFTINVVNIPDGYEPGKLTRTFYETITGLTVANLTGNARFPNDPDSVQSLAAFDGGGHGDNFGSTIRGYVIPTVSGTYQFWIASDDASELRFNSGGPAQGGTVIASLSGATAQYDWTATSSQQSATFNLVAGQPYYIEARHKEANGGDHVAVAWSGPGISRQVIPLGNLAPFDQNFTPRVSATTFQVYQTAPANHTLGTVTAMDANPGQSLHDYTITSGNAAGIFDIDPVTGRIFIAQAGLMNATTTPTHSLVVSVTDDGSPAKTGTATITVQVLAVPFNFVWTTPAGGNWKTNSNWQDNAYPNGSAHVADFTGLNLNANTTVSLDGTINVAAIKARDTTPSHDWTITPGSGGSLNLTDIGGAPYIDVANRSLIVAANITGSQGLTKTGAGSLVLKANCSYSGPTTVSGGTLEIGSADAAGSISGSSPVSIAEGAAVKWWYASTDPFNTVFDLPNAVSGSGQWTLQGVNDAAHSGTSVFTISADNSGFTGELILNRATFYQVSSPSQTGSGLMRVQEHATALVTNYSGVANTISIENGAGWIHPYGVFGAIHFEGTNSFIGNLQLNQSTGVVLGEQTGAYSTFNAWDPANAIFTGDISGPGELSMSRYTAWNSSTVNIDIAGTGSNTYTGKTVVNGSSNGSPSLRLMKTTGAAAIPGGNVVQLGNATDGQANLRMGDTTTTGAARNQWDNQFGTTLGGVQLNFVNASGQWMRFDLQGTKQSVAGLNAGTTSSQAGAVVQNQNLQAFDPGQDATLTLIGGGSYLYNGYLRDQDNGGTTRKLHLVKSGAGTQTLAGSALTYTGTTTINGGTLLITGSLGNTATTVAATGTLGGTGSIAGSVSNSGTLAPGSNGIGNLTVNNALTLAPGSKVAWDIGNWTGAAGTGWDKLTANSLNLTATSANRITVKLTGVSLTNFSETNRSFVIVQTTSGITGFSADKFTIDASGLTLPKGTWAVQQSGNNLVLAYTAQVNPDTNSNGILDSWEIQKFGNANPGANLPNDDADKDGLSNLVEYALDSNPVAANASIIAYDFEQLGDGKHLRLTIPKNAAATNLTCVVESCGALNDWSAANTTVETNSATQLIVRDNFTTGNASRRFIRLKVTSTP